MIMSTPSEKVLAETRKFREALPELLKTHSGEWVIFLDGEPKGFHSDEKTAYDAAVAEFGRNAGFVVAPVVETNPTPVTAAVMFGLAHA
jgi:hypothetical protein